LIYFSPRGFIDQVILIPSSSIMDTLQSSQVTFHPFPRLPVELRIQIWALGAPRRVFTFKPSGRYRYRVPKVRYLLEEAFMIAKLPEILSVNRESRYVGLGCYTDCFKQELIHQCAIVRTDRDRLGGCEILLLPPRRGIPTFVSI